MNQQVQTIPQELDQARRNLQRLLDAGQRSADETIWLNHPVIEYLDEGFVSAPEHAGLQKIKEQADNEISQMKESLHDYGVDFLPLLPVSTHSTII